MLKPRFRQGTVAIQKMSMTVCIYESVYLRAFGRMCQLNEASIPDATWTLLGLKSRKDLLYNSVLQLES